MAGERRRRILTRIAAANGPDAAGTSRLCEVSAEVTCMTGAAIMLMADDLPQGSICASDPVSALIERLHYSLGEGPCIDAFREGRPVAEPALADPITPRWLAFSGPALEAGVHAVFGFPLRIGAVRLGALSLHRDAPGPLTDEQHADAVELADVAAHAVLILQAGAPPGMLAGELEAGASLQYVVHQATGMVAAQLEVNVTHALVRLRAYAFGNERSLEEVARAVVNRELRFAVGTE